MDLLSKVKPKKEQKKYFPKFTNVDFNLKSIAYKLKDLNEDNYDDFKTLVYNSYKTILSDIHNEKMRNTLEEVFDNE